MASPCLCIFAAFGAKQTWPVRITCRPGSGGRLEPPTRLLLHSIASVMWVRWDAYTWLRSFDGLAHLGYSVFAPNSLAKSHSSSSNNKAKLPPGGSCSVGSCLRAQGASSIHHLRSALNNSILHDLLFIYAPIQYLFCQWHKWACCRIWSCEQNK